MIGAIIGDIVGSRFEWNNIKEKEFEFFHKDCFFTDDSVMTIALAKALMEMEDKKDFSDLSEKTIFFMQDIGRNYPDCGYGGHFFQWIFSDNPKPYNSFGNGAAMRISPCGWVGNSLKEVKKLAFLTTAISHDHPEGLKAAEAISVAIFLARTGHSREEIKKAMQNYYNLNFSIDGIRENYKYDVSSQGSVPPALVAFFESSSYEDAIRNVISIGGDSDTLAAITGALAEAYYGVSKDFRDKALTYLDKRLKTIYLEFEEKFLKKRH